MPISNAECDRGMIMEGGGIAGRGFRDYRTRSVQGKVDTSIAWIINES